MMSLAKNLVIDLRPSEMFSGGHIKGAVNKKFDEIPGLLRIRDQTF